MKKTIFQMLDFLLNVRLSAGGAGQEYAAYPVVK